jgi:hypothetical protein
MENVVERGRSQTTIWPMRIACWIPKATYTHTGCVMLIAFPLQQWLHERASMLRYTYVACLVSRRNFISVAVIMSHRSELVTTWLDGWSLTLQDVAVSAETL